MAYIESEHPRNPAGAPDAGSWRTRDAEGDDRDLDIPVIMERESLEAMGETQERALRRAIRDHDGLDGYTLSRRGEYITRRLQRIGRRDTQAYWSTVNPANGERVYREERARQHADIIQDVFDHATHVKREGKALLSGGLGGAGKSTILDSQSFADRHPGFDRRDYLTLNNDDIKEMMAARGMIPRLKGLTPMEASTLVHEEASDILAVIRMRALNHRMNVIMDGTMNNPDSMRRKIMELKRHGYRVDAMFVDISPDTSKRRADMRYRHGMDRYTMRGEGYGGRWLPAHVIDGQRDDSGEYRSRNARTVTILADEGLFDSTPDVYDNDVDGRAALAVPYDEFAHRSDDWF